MRRLAVPLRALLLPCLLAAAPAAAAPAEAASASAAPAAPGPDQPLILAIIPQAPPVRMHQRWTPFVERLSALLGTRVELKLYEVMEEFERDYAAGVPDLLFAHPTMAADAHVRQGFVPLVRDRKPISGLLLVRKDSPYRTLADLQGKRVAFVGPHTFCRVVIKELLAGGLADLTYQEQYAGSTRNVLKAVALGKADAGASLDVAVSAEPAELREELRTLAATRGLAPHPLSAHPRLPAAQRDRIQAAVLSMATSPEGRANLAAVRLGDPVTADYERDYRALEPAGPAAPHLP